MGEFHPCFDDFPRMHKLEISFDQNSGFLSNLVHFLSPLFLVCSGKEKGNEDVEEHAKGETGNA